MIGSRQFPALVIAAFLASACADAPSAPSRAAPGDAAPAAAEGVIPDRYVVVFRPDVTDAPGVTRRLAGEHGGTVHHTYRHALRGFSATLSAQAAAALRMNPQVAYVEQDRRVRVAQAASWGLDRVDQRDLPLNGAYTFTRGGAGVRVYVLDTGIDTSHPEFLGRVSVGYDAFGGSGQDCNGHGTHVAGTTGGKSYGVAKSVTLISVRVLPCSGEGEWSSVIAGLDWLRASHVKPAVANLSLAGLAMQAADDAVASLVASGVTVVAAAGNWSSDACSTSPARAPSAITVGATDASDRRAGFSNYGSCVDLFAPGAEIVSAWPGGGSATLGGTSMAAPHVAGAAAIHLQDNPGAAPASVAGALLANATAGRLADLGAGSPNLLLHSLPPGFTAGITGPSYLLVANNSVNATWTATAAGGSGAYSYRWQSRIDGALTWANVGTNSPTYTRTVSTTGRFHLRVIVTSGSASATSPTHLVVVERAPICPPGGC